MVKLLFKDLPDGKYFFTSDDENIQLLMHPGSQSEYIAHLDAIPSFLRKSVDIELTGDKKEFKNIQELVEYAKDDLAAYAKSQSYGELTEEDIINNFFFAPRDMVLGRFELVRRKIGAKEFKGVDLFLRQLDHNREVQDDATLVAELATLCEEYDNARFPNAKKDRIAKVRPKGQRLPATLLATNPRAA